VTVTFSHKVVVQQAAKEPQTISAGDFGPLIHLENVTAAQSLTEIKLFIRSQNRSGHQNRVERKSVEVLITWFVWQLFSDSPSIKDFLWKSLFGANIGDSDGMNIASFQLFIADRGFGAVPEIIRFDSYNRQLDCGGCAGASLGCIGSSLGFSIRNARLACLDCRNLATSNYLPVASPPKFIGRIPESARKDGD